MRVSYPVAWALPVLALLVAYSGTVRSLVDTWNSSDTYAHGYAIVPISAWLLWRQRHLVAAMQPTPWWPALALLLAAGAAWLLARLAQVQVVMQYAFVAMVPIAALAILGRRLAAALAFPLLFLLLAVPFGEIFVAPLIDFTAGFTVGALQLLGIPVLRNGTFFELPTGHWSVVEACSGLRYLISSFTIGCLYAYLTYRSPLRRAVFVLLSILVPILANGLRATMIVLIGHSTNMALATGVDHLIYGWIFFGIVMLGLFWIGSYWREETEQAAPSPVPQMKPPAPGMALAVIAVSVAWPVLALYSDRAAWNPKPVRIEPVESSWPAAAPFTTWRARYSGMAATLHRTYRQDGHPPVALSVYYYRNQAKGKALVSSTNRLTGERDTHQLLANGLIPAQAGALTVRESTLHGHEGSLLVWHWNWVDGQPVTNDYVAKLLQARSRLMSRGDDGAAILLAAPLGERDTARAALRAFLQTHHASIDAALAETRRR